MKIITRKKDIIAIDSICKVLVLFDLNVLNRDSVFILHPTSKIIFGGAIAEPSAKTVSFLKEVRIFQ